MTDIPDGPRGAHAPTISDVIQDTGAFAAFHVPGFTRIWASILTGNSGRFCLLVAAGWQAFQLTGSAFWSSVIAFCILIPVAVVGPVAGAVADRVNKASQMAVGQVTAGCCAVTAAVLIIFGELSLPLLVVTTVGIGVGNAIQNPAWSSLVPGVIGVQRMVNGGAMIRIAQQGSEFLGPAIATPLLVAEGPAAVYGLCAAFYSIGVLFAFSLRRRIPESPASTRGVLRPIMEALEYVATTQRILGVLLILVAFHCGLTMAYTGIVPKLATTNLRGASGVYGELLTAVGIGAVIGAAAVIVFARWLDLKFLLVVTGAGSGVTLVLLGLSHHIVLSLLGAGLVGATQSAFMALYLALLQGTAAPEMRGRVAAFSNILVGSTMSTGALAWGVLVGPVSAGWVLAAPGLLFVAILAIALVLSRWLRPPTIGKPRIASGSSSGVTAAPVG